MNLSEGVISKSLCGAEWFGLGKKHCCPKLGLGRVLSRRVGFLQETQAGDGKHSLTSSNKEHLETKPD